MANALTWAADQGARVANVSYGVSESSTVASACNYFRNKGGIVARPPGKGLPGAVPVTDPRTM